MDAALLDSLRSAVRAVPDDVRLRLHLAELLIDAGLTDEAIEHIAGALHADATAGAARALMARALRAPMGAAAPASPAIVGDSTVDPQTPAEPVAGPEPHRAQPAYASEDQALTFGLVERPTIRLSDVGGLAAVKQRLESAFLAPLRNPGLRAMYGKSLRGGLLLYGPPGCGKTYLARALAGELDAGFLHIGLNDVLDMWLGQSERNVHELFQHARHLAPCVVFLDEVDALGQKRSQLTHSAMRGTVNQLLLELDGVGTSNDGVFVLAATNQPWDVDPALRRPGRLDRMLLVPPPDESARRAILDSHLADRPTTAIDTGRLARATEGYSGADLAHVVETATERALLDAIESGVARAVTGADLEAAVRDVRPSIGPWLESARNVALFANSAGEYDDLLTYLKKRRLA